MIAHAVLVAEGLQHSVRLGRSQPRVLFQDVDMVVERGSWWCITGPSGSGKTTLLQGLAGLIQLQSGHVHFQGFDLAKGAEQDRTLARRSMGFVFQHHHLLTECSVLDNVMLPLCLNGHPRPQQAAIEALREVGIDDVLQEITTLSGGERQRVAVARAVVHRPSVLFADEPAGSLDAPRAQTLLASLQRLREQQGVTIIMVTHAPERLDALPDITYAALDGGTLAHDT